MRIRLLFGRQHFAIHDKGSSNNQFGGDLVPAASSTNFVPTINIHVDAAFSSSLCTYGIVVSDASNVFFDACSGMGSISTPLEVKILANLEALRFLSWHCFTVGSIHSDSLLAATYLHSTELTWPWRLILILTECLSLWSLRDIITINHISRNDNLQAHVLARERITSATMPFESQGPTE